MLRLLSSIFILALLLTLANAAEEPLPQQAAAILSANCIKCHNSDKRAGGIDLSTRSAALAAGVLPGASGRLARAVSSGKMPPTGKLDDEQIATLKAWSAVGAEYPAA